MIATSLATAFRPLWRLLEDYKVDPELVFREAGLDPARMDEPRGRYKVARGVAAWAKAMELIDDPCFGLKLNRYWSPTDFHALGYAFLASCTLRMALGRLTRYVHVVNDVIAFEPADTAGHASFSLCSESPLFLPPLAPMEDSVWAYVMGFCRSSYGPELNPVEVRLLHAEPSCRSDYFRFFRCPVHFASATSEVVFSSSDLDRQLPAGNRELAMANDRILSDFLRVLDAPDLITRVKTAIAEALPSGTPSDDTVAKSLYMSSRSLQRKLAEEGTSYSRLIASVRQELAEQYLADSSLSLSEISFLLGFSELSAFSRAFRRWTSQSPSAVREAATG
jgi:AraC-like DNA-binding protein